MSIHDVYHSDLPHRLFCFVQNFFFRTTQELEYLFFCRAKRKFFFQNLTLGYMTKTLNHIIFSFLHNLKNDPRCVCGHLFENAIHFFLECPLYQHDRISLFNYFNNIVPISIEYILFGCNEIKSSNK
jgi:hypothetical protein